jgi:hypothetical protein
MITQLLRFEYDNRKYRVMSNSNDRGDVDIYVEQYQYDAKDSGKSIWSRVSIELIDQNKMTMMQCVEILSVVSRYVSENFVLVAPIRGGRCTEPGE